MSEKQPSLFTRISKGEIPGKFVYQDDLVFAIHDINPQAPFHVLIIPREELVNVYDAHDGNEYIMGRLMVVAAKIAAQEGLKNGFRLIINNGEDAKQEVPHLHMHMLAGANLGPMTCR